MQLQAQEAWEQHRSPVYREFHMDPLTPQKYWEWDLAQVWVFDQDLGVGSVGLDYPWASSQGKASKDGKNQEGIMEGREKLNQHWNFSDGKIPSGASPASFPG